MKRILLWLIAGFLSLPGKAQNRVVINADLGKDTISRHIYGHFAEHLGRCIYDGFYLKKPDQNIPTREGIRLDIIEALKKLQIPNLRWPGGCFADTYHWKDGIGPKEKRPTMVNIWWGGITEDNSFGTHEFLNMCEMLGTEPYLAGNVGSGTVQELADWVKYVNYQKGSGPMADLRSSNGRENPWQVRFWGVGNEVWGCGGNMKPEYYTNIYKQFATFMTSWSNSAQLFRVASGANSSDFNWTEVMMRDIPHSMLEGVALHHYSVIDWNHKGPATGFTEEQYFTTMKRALYMEELVRKHSTIMDKYDPQKKVALVVDEWGGWYDVEPGTNPAFLFQQNTIRDAMIAGVTLNIFNNHCDRVRMANLAQTVNVLQAVILTQGEKLILTPTYHVMEMYKVHQDALLLPVSLSVNDYELGKEKLTAISVSASKDKNNQVHISLVNISNQAQNISVDIRGFAVKQVSGRILTSAKVQDFNRFEKPDLIKPEPFKDIRQSANQITINMPPHSVVVLSVNESK